MNATQYMQLIQSATAQAVREGIQKKQLGWETAIGVLEVNKQLLVELRNQAMFQQPPMIMPANGNEKLPPAPENPRK